MVDVSSLRLGWKPAPPDPRTLRLANYLTPDLPAPPRKVDWCTRVPAWPMLGNDRVGDCAVASLGHTILGWSTYATTPTVPSLSDVLAAYSALSGYDPATGANDNGTTSRESLNFWRNTGVGGHRIVAYAAVNMLDHAEVRAALQLFGGLIFGADLPLSAQAQIRAGNPWRPVAGPSGTPGSWGGHQFAVRAADTRHLTAVTWGATQRLTWAWADRYVAEAYACVGPEWLDPHGRAPSGIDLPALLGDLNQVTG